jgi:hypothetical protein
MRTPGRSKYAMVSTLLSSRSLLRHQRRLLAPRETQARPVSSDVGCLLPGTRDVPCGSIAAVGLSPRERVVRSRQHHPFAPNSAENPPPFIAESGRRRAATAARTLVLLGRRNFSMPDAAGAVGPHSDRFAGASGLGAWRLGCRWLRRAVSSRLPRDHTGALDAFRANWGYGPGLKQWPFANQRTDSVRQN